MLGQISLHIIFFMIHEMSVQKVKSSIYSVHNTTRSYVLLYVNTNNSHKRKNKSGKYLKIIMYIIFKLFTSTLPYNGFIMIISDVDVYNHKLI